MTDTKIVFNGDTASGRAQWVPWRRSLALTLDEWAWSVLNNDVLPHGKVKKIMDKRPASRTDEEKEDLADTLEEACKGRDARKRKKRIEDVMLSVDGINTAKLDGTFLYSDSARIFLFCLCCC